MMAYMNTMSFRENLVQVFALIPTVLANSVLRISLINQQFE